MEIEEIKLLYEYNYWARDRVMDAAANLSYEQITAPSSMSFGSMMSNLTHILNAEWIWRERCQTDYSPDSMLLEAKITNLETLQQTWLDEEIQMRAYIRELEGYDLARTVYYR